MARYNIYAGKFKCHTCNKDVTTLRSYPSEKRLTWMCSDRHVSEVNLQTKKNKKDYE